MIKKENLQGLVIQCNEIGIIEKIIRDDFHICNDKCLGKPLINLFHKNMVTHVLDFLMQIKNENFAFDSWLALSEEKYNASLYFSGFFLEKKVWIIGAGSSSAIFRFVHQLQQINNEQVNQIRMLAKHKVQQQIPVMKSDARNQKKSEQQQLDEMSRLNNELVNLQREMAKKNAELARVNELKNYLLGMAAHDLRNPLGNIMAFAGFLEEETKSILNNEHREFLNIISASAEFMLKLIEDLLDLSKIESGKLTLNPEVNDLIELADRSVLFNNAIAAKKSITISLESDHKTIRVKFDKQKMEQVFNNLLSNAVKFSFPKSEILLQITRSEGKVKVEVIDQGIGIPANNLETIFQPFNSASGSGTAGEKSTGLGLSIVKKIIEGHHGRIGVKSVEGKGSHFYFELPLEN
ncbi:MAG: HAMP domain-containing sensor histidine kinase [Mariniphaga sp.]